MHLIFSLGYLMLTTGLVFVYLLGTFSLIVAIRWCLETWKGRKTDGVDKDAHSSVFKKNDWWLVALLLLFAISLNAFVYFDQRQEWMGDDNAHLTAKEYFVAGQVVFGIRTAFRTFLRVDSIISWPFFALQKNIYERGIQYLPEDDGERGVWTDLWFVYLYAKKNGAPKGTSDVKLSPKLLALLDTSWGAIEQASTYPFADRQMEVQHYYRNLPGQAFYYNFRKGYYAGDVWGSRKFFTRDPKLIARSRKLVQWLTALEQKWQSSAETLSFLEQHPKVSALWQMVLSNELSDVIINEIITGTFSCENKSVGQYLSVRQSFIGDGATKPPYQRMADHEQAKSLYTVVVNTRMGMFQKYILKKYCGQNAAGIEDPSVFTRKLSAISSQERKKRNMNNLFKDEILALEEWASGR